MRVRQRERRRTHDTQQNEANATMKKINDWFVYRLGKRSFKVLGLVKATNQESALAKAYQDFKIETDHEDIVVDRIDPAKPLSAMTRAEAKVLIQQAFDELEAKGTLAVVHVDQKGRKRYVHTDYLKHPNLHVSGLFKRSQ